LSFFPIPSFPNISKIPKVSTSKAGVFRDSFLKVILLPSHLESNQHNSKGYTVDQRIRDFRGDETAECEADETPHNNGKRIDESS
jgi:hypothetical protein